MGRIVLGLEYNGMAYAGWQAQAHGDTLQDRLEYAISQIAATRLRCICAGRTDAGVHATLQVAHFDCPLERPLSAWVRGVNALLPADMAVLWAKEVSAEFHARYSALSRRYVYCLLNRAQRPGLLNGRVGWLHQPLNVARMVEAANALLGEHDFSAFRSAQCQAKSPVRQMRSIKIFGFGELIQFEFCANAFLHHMVRNLVGCLLAVGRGTQAVSWPAELLAARDRRLAAPTFSPAGLYLTGVEYAAHWGLPVPAQSETCQDFSLGRCNLLSSGLI